MQLTGDLSDFALTDILQILALSRKTGMVMLEGAGWMGKIIVESGRITAALAEPGETLADSLTHAGLLIPGEAGVRSPGAETLRVGGSFFRRSGLLAVARRHTQRVIARLVRMEKGRFSIALGEALLPRSIDGLRLTEGLDVGEALLFAAHEQDESYRERDLKSLAEDDRPGGFSLNGGRETRPFIVQNETPDLNVFKGTDDQNRSALLCSLLTEMKQHSFEAEVSLLIMRYASEMATRGILFAIKDSNLCGLGQFGVNPDNGKSADELVRELCLPLEADSVFARVVRTGEPFIGGMPDSYWFSELLSRVGGYGRDLKLFVLPLTCNEAPAFVLYGDNYPGNADLNGVGELFALASQASLVLERIALQRRVVQLEAGH
jgi:hypothetical protein